MTDVAGQILNNDGTIAITVEPERTVTVAGLGDLSFHGAVLPRLYEQDREFVFAEVAKRLSACDVVIGNLESVLVASPYSPLVDKATLVSSLRALDEMQAAGINVATVANNHILDAGRDGLLECLAALHRSPLQVAGAGRDSAEARIPARITRGGIDFTVFSYSYAQNQIADDNKPGCNEARRACILRDLDEFSKSDDFVVVCLHMDAEFQPTPAPARIALCRRLAERGAKLVLCHHPHVPQGIEIHAGCVIVYSLGNYVFPMLPYLTANSEDCQSSYHIEAKVSSAGVHTIEVVPIRIGDDGCPVVATGSSRRELLQLVAERSADLLDTRKVEATYYDMTRRYASGFVLNSLRALRSGNFGLLTRYLTGLAGSPIKREWFGDCLRLSGSRLLRRIIP